MRRSLARRALVYTVSASLISLMVAFVLFWGARAQYSISQRTDQLSGQTVALAKGLDIERELTGSAAAIRVRDQLFRVEARLLNAALFVTDHSGEVARSSGQLSVTSIPIESLGRPSDSGVRTGVRRMAGDNVTALMVAAPMPNSTEYLVAVQPLHDVVVPIEQITPVALEAFAVSLLVALLLGSVLGRRLSEPLVRLRDGAESIASGDWGAQVPEEGDAEIASLARSFNRMSARAAEAYSAQKSFVGDVSHELRTPITSIRGYSEAIMDGTLSGPEDTKRAASVIHSEAMRMEEMSHTLLALAALDAESATPEVQPIDLVEFREAIHERFESTAQRTRVSLELEIASLPCPVGDPERLLQAASAVISNGLWYTPAGGSVRVRSLTTPDGRWALQIDDNGPGIPAERRKAVFERFVRLDPSRSKGSGGVGLGLAIAKRAVELTGGTIEAGESDDMGGARLVIGLPLADERA